MNLTEKLKTKIKNRVLEELPSYQKVVKLRKDLILDVKDFLYNELTEEEKTLCEKYPFLVNQQSFPPIHPDKFPDGPKINEYKDHKSPKYMRSSYFWKAENIDLLFRQLNKDEVSLLVTHISIRGSFLELKENYPEYYDKIVDRAIEIFDLILESLSYLDFLTEVLNADYVDLNNLKKHSTWLYNIIKQLKDEKH